MNARILSLPEFKSLLQRGESPGESPIIRCGMTLIEKALDSESLTINFVASTSETDRHGDRIMVSGWKLDRFMSNPIMLWGHDYSSMPIGRVQTLTITGDTLRGQALLDGDDPLARKIAAKIDRGMLNSVSVGLLPLEYNLSKDPGREYGLDIVASELLEISVVSVPANPSALIDRRDAPPPLPKFCAGSRKRAERVLSLINLRGSL